MTEEHLTADLLKQLSAAARPEDYLLQGETIDRELSDYLNELRNDRGMKRAAVVRESAVNETFVYDIFKGKSLPGRDNALKLAFALRCSLIETQRILRLAGVSELWPKRSRDFGARIAATPSSSGASNAASHWRNAMTSSIAWASKRW